MIVRVRNFGKIESADINLSSLTIFVGENNSGKTYLMQLIYGLLTFFQGINFINFLGRFDKLTINKEITNIASDNKEFYNAFQFEINNYINNQKNNIVKKTFHTNTLKIESLSIDFGNISDDYLIKCEDNTENYLFDESLYKSFSIIKNNKIISRIRFENITSDDHIKFIIKQRILKTILNELIGITNRKLIDDTPVLFLPASRSGLMLLYSNYLANTKIQNVSENENIIYETNNKEDFENEYGLTEPIYDFLMFLLKHKNSEMITETDKEIISFINNNIINGSLERIGNTMRYKPTSSEHSIPIYLSSSLVSELSPIYQILSGIQHYDYILYDEIETCQHPTKQIQLARLLARMVNSGYKMIVSTHSDTMVAAINNLITLSFKKNKKELADKLNYDKLDLFNSDDIKAYQFILKNGKTNVIELPAHFSIGLGFDFDIFNIANDKIYQDALVLAKED